MEQEIAPGKIVVCKITKINPHSAFATIEGCGKEGLIHISEIASGWVKDINQHVREGDVVVAKIMRTDGNTASLSLKRVDRNSRESRLREYKKEIKAGKMLEIAAKKMKQQGKASEISDAIIGKYGSLSVVFDAGTKAREMLAGLVSDKWVETISEIAEKSIQDREFEFKANLKLITYDPDGIKKITEVLKKCETEGFDVSYISAPDYMLRFVSKEAKKGGHEFEKKLKEIEDYSKKMGCLKEIKAIK